MCELRGVFAPSARVPSAQKERIMSDVVFNLPRLLTIDDLAEYMSVDKSTAYRWVRQGRGPKSVRPTKDHIRFTEAAILEWLAADNFWETHAEERRAGRAAALRAREEVAENGGPVLKRRGRPRGTTKVVMAARQPELLAAE